MITRTFSRTLNAGPRQSLLIPLLFRNHMRFLVAAFVMSLFVATLFLVPGTEGANYLPSPPVSVGPTNLQVTSTSNTAIALSWTPSGGAAHYRVERSANINGPFTFISTAPGTTFTDTAVTSQSAYLYRVRAVAADEPTCPSEPSNMALGTALSFEFSQLTNQTIRAQHVHDLRIAINAVRSVANLPAANWSRGPLNNLQIQAADLLELRSRLNEALEALEIPIDLFQDPILATGANGTPVRAAHFEQLQIRSTRGVRTNPNPTVSGTGKHVIGEFGDKMTLPLVPVHLSVLPNGRILFWGRDKNIDANGNVKEIAGKSEAYVWNIDEGSNKTDLAVFRPSENKWYVTHSSTGDSQVIPWGESGDVPVPGDYDGDGRVDIAVYRPSNGLWGIVNSSNGSQTAIGFGILGDVPVPGDYDQDGKTDIAIFRPSDGLWGVRFSGGGPDLAVGFGIQGDIPVPGDYDQDRKSDLAVFRPSENTWYIRKSSSTFQNFIEQWGANGDVPAPGDYNGDGATDLAVYRASDGRWYIKNIADIPDSTDDFFVGQAPSAKVVTGDYDGDGKTDGAIYRPSDGQWIIRRSSTGYVVTMSWGQNGDVPVAKDYDGMRRVFHSSTNLFCSGHSFLSDGRLLVSGGHKSPDQDGVGEPHTNFFDFRSNSWVRGPEMNAGRWYPYNVTLNNGETLIVSGAITPSTRNNVPQILGSCLRDLNAPDVVFSTYPFLHLTPKGKVLVVQSGKDKRESRLLDPFAFPSPSPTPWEKPGNWEEDFPSMIHDHWTGSSVLFQSGTRVLVLGGFDPLNNPLNTAEFIDLTAANPTWKSVHPMNFPRTYHTTTILPDGKVLVTGGVKCRGSINIECGTVMNAEMWDPTSSSCPTTVPWRTMAAQDEVRAYHSVAALLPDGRVLVGGGGLPGAEGEQDLNGRFINDVRDGHARLFGHKTIEFYSPPYLFDANGNAAARPLITSAPETILYGGASFSVTASEAGSTPQVSLVRLASVTHGFNQDQRHLFLNASANGSTINVTPPADSNICPPGYYMLFVLNNGVPSKAKIVRVGSASMFNKEVPVTYQEGQGSTWEQGLEFSSNVAGQITAIRYWKHPDEPKTVTHTGRIWDATSGALLASVPFTCETDSGWQEARLTTPQTIQANKTYRVSYNIQSVVAKTSSVFNGGPITRGPLTGWGSYFRSPAGEFPNTFSGSNLFADIVFKTGQ